MVVELQHRAHCWPVVELPQVADLVAMPVVALLPVVAVPQVLSCWPAAALP